MKKNLAVMFGGYSVEHEISVVTALQAIRNIDDKKYNIIPIYLKDGEWFSGKQLLDVDFYKYDCKAKKISMIPNSKYLYKKGLFLWKYKKIDVALLCFHGYEGEDGCVQGLLELNRVPYTSSGVTGSALSCDKILFKEVLKGFNIDCVNSVNFNKNQYYANQQKHIIIGENLSYPIVVKPNCLGSSIGISVCKNREELKDALDLAFSLDNRVLLEEYCKDMREINCAVMGYDDDIVISELEEPITKNEILSFENKYLNNQKQGMASATRKIPAEIANTQSQKIKEIAKFLFNKLELKGVVRFDFMVTEEKIYLNELNSIPGSLAFYLFEPQGISYQKMLDKLILWAILDTERKSKFIRKFEKTIFTSISLDGIKK